MDYNNNYYNNGNQMLNARYEIDSCVGSAFGKGLAATIMAWFPICSIIAIVLGNGALQMNALAEQMAAASGLEAGGKNIAAKVLGKVGKIGGIVMTAFYGFYFLYFIFIFMIAFA